MMGMYEIYVNGRAGCQILAASADDAIRRVAGLLPPNTRDYTIVYTVQVQASGEVAGRDIAVDPVVPSCITDYSHRWQVVDVRSPDVQLGETVRCVRCEQVRTITATDHTGHREIRYYR
jgi:hypothetical protein